MSICPYCDWKFTTPVMRRVRVNGDRILLILCPECHRVLGCVADTET